MVYLGKGRDFETTTVILPYHRWVVSFWKVRDTQISDREKWKNTEETNRIGS